MIVQEDIPYTKEGIKAMVKTIHDLREQLKQLGWHPASELPPLDEDGYSDEVIVIAAKDNDTYRHGPMIDKPSTSMIIDGEWDTPNVKWWCYPPKEE